MSTNIEERTSESGHSKAILDDAGTEYFSQSNTMSLHLRHYLLDAYKSQRNFFLPEKQLKSKAIQIDDQDDNDSLSGFCNLFCSVDTNNKFTLKFVGKIPITQELIDLVEIYNGTINQPEEQMSLTLNLEQIDVVQDLSNKIRNTSLLGDEIHNPSWVSISARTIASLYRFVRIIKEYKHQVHFQ